jgi:hypothetical protein
VLREVEGAERKRREALLVKDELVMALVLIVA